MPASRTLRHSMVAAGLAAGGGALYAAALPPLGLWPLGWIAVAPLCWACARATPGRGATYGALFGVMAAALTSPWLPAMIADYFQAPAPAAWPLALAVWLLAGGLYHTIFGAWLAWASGRGRPVSALTVGAAWWALDWARANAPLANPWALLGYSQMGWLPAAQIADLFGPYGIGALLAAFGAALSGLARGRGNARLVRRETVIVLCLVAITLLYGRTRLGEQEQVGGEAIEVGLVQGAIAPERRYAPEHARANLESHLELTGRSAAAGAELVVWPELAMDFYIEREPALRRRLMAALTAMPVDVMAGGLGVPRRPVGTRPSNSVFLLTGRGVRGRYDKVRLMPFAETAILPFGLSGEDPVVAGHRPVPIRRHQVEFGLAVCSEAMHPAFVRQMVRAGAEVLVTPSVDSWFGALGASRQQLEAVAMRAIETRRFVLRPTASGFTAVIDPQGRIIAEAPVGVPAFVVARIRPREERTPYVRYGDAGVLVAFGWVCVDALRRRRGTSPSSDQSCSA